MSEVEWIKITVDMFDNRKIKHLRKLPEGNSIVLIWVMLLTMAGRCNAGGMIFLTENIPYTPKMLADELGFEENTVILALEALERLGMIRSDGFLEISGWDEYQNTDGLNRIREQTRQRVAKHREKQKLLPCNVTVTLRNATDKEEDRDIERERDIEIYPEKDSDKEPEKEPGKDNTPSLNTIPEETEVGRKKRFVPPTLDEISAYVAEKGLTVNPKTFYEYFNTPNASGKTWIDSKGNAVRNWKQKLLTWNKFSIGVYDKADSLPDESGTGFDEFCNAYPIVEERKPTYEAYLLRLKDGYSAQELIEAAKAYARKCRTEHVSGRYIKSSKRFLEEGGMFVGYIPKGPVKEPENTNPFSEYDVEVLRVGV